MHIELTFYPAIVPENWFQVSGFSPAAGQKNGRSNRRRKLNGINIQFSDRINRMDRINILKQNNPDNPVNPV